MRAIDGLRLAAGGLRERKTRTALTVLGIVIGTSMIVALSASTEGQTAAIQDQLERLGPTTLIVRSNGQTRFDAASLDTALAVEGVDSAFLAVSGPVQITRAGFTGSATLMGVAPDDLERLVKDLTVLEGSMYGEGDLTSAFAGYDVASPDPDNGTYVYTGDFLTVASTSFSGGRGVAGGSSTITRTLTMSGVAAEFGSAPFVDVDNTVFVPVRTAQQILRLNAGQHNQMIVFAESTERVATLPADLRAALGNGANVQSGAQLASTITAVYDRIGGLLGTVAAISLLVAGVGIANTMFVSVLERTTEIGLLKALGFRAREVMGVFLLEAALTGLLGGVLGCLAGIGLSHGIGSFIAAGASTTPGTAGAAAAGGRGFGAGGGGGFGGGGGGFPGGGPSGAPGGLPGGAPGGGSVSTLGVDATPVFTSETFLLALAFAVAIALLAGLVPSRKAARLDPVVALKRL